MTWMRMIYSVWAALLVGLVPLFGTTQALEGRAGVEQGLTGGGAAGDTHAVERRPMVSGRDGHGLGKAICYGPYRDGQRPGGPTPTAAQIAEDLRLMQPHWRLIRLYGSSEFGRRVLEGIHLNDLDMEVMLGVWIAPERTRDEGDAESQTDAEAVAANRREIDAAIALAKEYPHLVVAVCVGNETQVSWSAHRLPVDDLIRAIREVRAKVMVPVTTADDYQYWLTPESRRLTREIDFITLHAHPLWNGQQLDEALPWLDRQVAAVQAVHPETALIIGETGWATDKSGEGEQARLMRGETGEAEQARFYAAAQVWASQAGLLTFYFEAFDENWKGGADPHDAEKHWGFFRADRTPKLALQ